MDIISEVQAKIKEILSRLGYKDELVLIHSSSRPDLGRISI